MLDAILTLVKRILEVCEDFKAAEVIQIIADFFNNVKKD